jgi:hypothetical protein
MRIAIIGAGSAGGARLLEPSAMLRIHLMVPRDLGRDFAFSLLRHRT